MKEALEDYVFVAKWLQILNVAACCGEYLNTLDQCHIDRLIHCCTLILRRKVQNSLEQRIEELAIQ